MISKAISRAAIPLCLATMVACSVVQPPNTLATQARESVQRAESLGADETAPLVLREANQYLSQAEQAMQREDFKEATRLLEKSLINADLAIARTNSQKSQQAAEEIEQNLEALRNKAVDGSDSDSYSFQ